MLFIWYMQMEPRTSPSTAFYSLLFPGYTSMSSPTSSTFKPPKSLNTPIISLVPGQWFTASIGPLSFWKGKLMVRQPSHYQMNITIAGGNLEGSVALYGRLGTLPTVTNYDWVHLIEEDGSTKSNSHLVKRSILHRASDGIKISKFLTRGQWYIGLFNDADEARTMRITMGQRRRGSVCPGDCHGQGICDDGKCRCFPQFSGPLCSESKFK